MLHEAPISGIEVIKGQLGLLRLKSLLTIDSYKKKIPDHQRVFFRALADRDNFRLLPIPKKEYFDKLIAPGHGNRYRLYSSFLYSMLYSEKGKEILGGNYPSLYDPNLDQWKSTIQVLLSDSSFSDSFKKAIEVNQQGIYPESVPSLRIIINRLFPSNKSLTIYDFGCGQNFDLPAMQAKNTTINDKFQPPEELNKYNHAVNLEKGVGIDSNGADDINWTKICTGQHEKDMVKISEKINLIDELVMVRDSAKNIQRIRASIFDFKPERAGNVILTKWMRYQIDEQEKVTTAVLNSLEEGGYWISVGEVEKLKSKAEGKKLNFETDEIWVWQKQGNRLVPIGSNPNKPGPLVIIKRGKIDKDSFDKEFFAGSSKEV